MSKHTDTTGKTPFSDDELDHFKDLLLEKRHEAKQELDELKESIENLADSEQDERSAATHHQGDIASDTEEEETLYRLIERKKKYIKQIDEALGRIEGGTYGICQATGKKIPKERLEAVPHTRYSIEAKNKGLVEDS